MERRGRLGSRQLCLSLVVQMSREVSHNRVAFAGRFFKPLALDHLDMAAPISDQPALLQAPCSRGDAGAPNSEHLGKKLLGQIELIALNPVLDHEQPPSYT